MIRSAVNFNENGEAEPVNLRIILEEPPSLAIENVESETTLITSGNESNEIVKRFTTMTEIVINAEGKGLRVTIDPELVLGYEFAREKDGTH